MQSHVNHMIHIPIMDSPYKRSMISSSIRMHDHSTYYTSFMPTYIIYVLSKLELPPLEVEVGAVNTYIYFEQYPFSSSNTVLVGNHGYSFN